MQNRQSIFKFKSRFYNVQSNDDVKHRGMKLRQNNKVFPSLSLINGKTPYEIKGVLINYHYRYDPKLCQEVVALRLFSWNCHACTTKVSLPWDTKIKYACNKTRYGRVYDCNYYLIIGSQNNWIIMDFLNDGTDEVEYEQINIKYLMVMLLTFNW